MLSIKGCTIFIQKIMKFRPFYTNYLNKLPAIKRLIPPAKYFITCEVLRQSTVTYFHFSKFELEDKLHKACQEGETAILNLMDHLKECVINTSHQYRLNIDKQIEITRRATQLGPLSQKWDELPPMRCQSDELLAELKDYMLLFNIIGEMAFDQSLISIVTCNLEATEQIKSKYKDLEILLLHETELNKLKEAELLQAKRNSILEADDEKEVKGIKTST